MQALDDRAQESSLADYAEKALNFQFAPMMLNSQYLVGDPETREVACVDCAWDFAGIKNFAAERLGLKVVSFVASHGHLDHVGGNPLLNQELPEDQRDPGGAGRRLRPEVWEACAGVRAEGGDLSSAPRR